MTEPVSSAAAVSHAADRLARAIVVATASPTDPRTLTAWGQEVGVSRGALRVWCRAAHVPARGCLDFVRVLRAILLSTGQRWDLFSALDIVDERSLSRLLVRGGVSELRGLKQAPTVESFLGAQRFVTSGDVVAAVTKRLKTDRR